METKFKTITDVKEANKAAGQHWFSKNTMAFLKSRIESRLYKGKYFITSELGPIQTNRKYTIREAKQDGQIKTVGEFQEFSSLAKAKERVQELD